MAQDLGVAESRVPGVETQRHVDRLQADAVSETAFHFGEEAVVEPAVAGDVVAEQVVAEVDDPLEESGGLLELLGDLRAEDRVAAVQPVAHLSPHQLEGGDPPGPWR